jgi:rhodanese-related sulfurtransferase
MVCRLSSFVGSSSVVVAALASIALAQTPTPTASPPSAVEAQAPAALAVAPITQEEVLARLGSGQDTVVLDVRTAQEFAAGHVPGAINIPHDQVEARIGELEHARDREIVVYCRTGRRSDLALQILAARGFSKLLHLEGDYLAWQAAGRPVGGN